MNPESYFENEPWEHAAADVRKGAVGAVKAASVQAVRPTLHRRRASL